MYSKENRTKWSLEPWSIEIILSTFPFGFELIKLDQIQHQILYSTFKVDLKFGVSFNIGILKTKKGVQVKCP